MVFPLMNVLAVFSRFRERNQIKIVGYLFVRKVSLPLGDYQKAKLGKTCKK